jgi:hypothetical protein
VEDVGNLLNNYGQWPTLDKIILQWLGGLGVSGTILALLGVASFARNWLGDIRAVAAGAATAGRTARSLAQYRPVRGVVSVFISLVVPAAQVLTLGLCYLVGNYMSIALDPVRQRMVEQAVGDDPWRVARDVDLVMSLSSLLTVDLISGAYLALAVTIMALSYPWAVRGRDTTLAGAVLAFPATLLIPVAWVGVVGYLVVCAFGVALLAVGALFGQWSTMSNLPRDMVVIALPLVAAVAGIAAFWFACQGAVRGPRLIVSAWSTVSSSPVTAGASRPVRISSRMGGAGKRSGLGARE